MKGKGGDTERYSCRGRRAGSRPGIPRSGDPNVPVVSQIVPKAIEMPPDISVS